MEFEPTEYVRKVFNVKAVEVTFKNVEAVAKWCKGKVDTETTRILGGAETELPVIVIQGHGKDRGKELIARLGYFVVQSKGNFLVYKAAQFHAAFEEVVPTIKSNPEAEKEWCISHNYPMDSCPHRDHVAEFQPYESEEEAEADQEKDDALWRAGHDNSSVDGQETVHVSL